MVKLSRHVWQMLCTGLFAGAAVCVAPLASAQTAATYPNKPVRVIIPFAAGGAVTPVITVLGEKVSKETGQNFLQDYRPGGDTVVGVNAAAKSPPDGYTLLLATSSYLANQFMTPNLPYDTLNDLAPVAMLGRSTYVLVVHPSVANSLGEFLGKAKARPGEFDAAYVGSVALLNLQIFLRAAGAKFTPVSYKATPQAAAALVAGEVAVTMSGLSSVQPLIKAGKLKALAVTGNARMPLLADVPTFAEAGLKDFNTYNWFILAAPAKTPRDIMEKVNAQFRRAQQVPDAAAALGNINIDPFITTVDETERFIRSEAALYDKVVKETGIRAEAP